jgi:Holliday junction resolvase RusA-like endonuclease
MYAWDHGFMGTRVLTEVQETINEDSNLSKVLFTAKIKVPFHATKKNKYRIGKARMFKDDRTLWYEEIVMLELRSRANRVQLNEPLSGPLWAMFRYYFPKYIYFTKKRQMSGRLPDLSNLHEAIQDCLQKAEIIQNDRLICSHDGSRRLVGDEYLLEVKLMRFNE